MSKLNLGVVATLARAWVQREVRLYSHGLATAATPRFSLDKALVAGAKAVMDALVSALSISNDRLNKKALLALVRIGQDALPKLRIEAQRPSTQRAHRERLLRVIQRIDQNGKQPGNAVTAVADVLIDALRVDDKDVNAKGADALCHLKTAIVERLVLECYRNRRNPGFCVRLIGVVERIGKMPDVGCHLDLFTLAACKTGQVKEAAWKALFSVGPLKNDISRLGQGSEPDNCIN